MVRRGLVLSAVVTVGGCSEPANPVEETSADTDPTSSDEATGSSTADTGADSGGVETPTCVPPTPRGRWVVEAALPRPSSGFALSRGSDGTPLLIGGSGCGVDDDAAGRQVLRWEGADLGWSAGAELPQVRANPVTVHLADGELLVVDGAGDEPSFRTAGDQWQSLGAGVGFAVAYGVGSSDDTVLVTDLEGTQWRRSEDRGESWLPIEGPRFPLFFLVPSRLDSDLARGIIASGAARLQRYDVASGVWEVADSTAEMGSAAVRYDQTRFFAVAGESGIPGPTGTVPRIPVGLVFEPSSAWDSARIGFPCRPTVSDIPALMTATYGASTERAFVLMYGRGGFVFDEDGPGVLPEPPSVEAWVALENGTLLGVGGEDCSREVWRWVPE